MHLGQLDRLITIETPTSSFDSYKYETKSWATYSTPWAMLSERGGDESYEADELVAGEMVTFVVRYDSGLNAKMRVSFNSEYYEILAISEVGRNEFQELKCRVKDSKMI